MYIKVHMRNVYTNDAIAVLKCHEIKCNFTVKFLLPQNVVLGMKPDTNWLAKVVGSELLQFYELEI